ncbi:hypothetical protein [Streptomyces sp. NPDC091219]|uniref:hypothetical protein n=1 Tax=Streptomyces sp. NPDC091219 TaxID=3155193 RepID=UPI00344FFB0B
MSAALVAFSALAAAAGCSSGGGDTAQTSPSPATASATAAVSASDAQDRKDVISAYQGMTDEQVKAYAKSSLAGSRITTYATGKALRDVKNSVFVNLQNGIVVKGEPKVTAGEDDVTLNSTGTAQRASLTVCFDMNTWEPVDKKTGKSVAPPHQVKRYTIAAQLQKQGSQWQVTDEKADKERTC